MKAMSHIQGASDRIATREELCQVIDLLESIPTGRELGRSQTAEFPLAFVAGEAPTDSKGLWLDSSEEESGAESLDASLESLAELFADRSDLVN